MSGQINVPADLGTVQAVDAGYSHTCPQVRSDRGMLGGGIIVVKATFPQISELAKAIKLCS